MRVIDAIPQLLQLLGVGLALAIVGITWITLHTLRNPARRTYAWAAARGRPGAPDELEPPRAFEERAFDTTSGPLSAWTIPGDDPDGPIVVVCPGWGDSRLGTLPRLHAFIRRARLVVPFDPPGHGDTPETAGRTALGLKEPMLIDEIVRTLLDEHPGARVLLYGWSLGAGACIVSATRLEPGIVIGVVAEAPYELAPTPARNVVRLSGLPWRINIPLTYFVLARRIGKGILGPHFARSKHAAKLPATCPLLVLHGSADAIAPVVDGETIANAAPDGTLVTIDGAGHNNLWTDDRFKEAATDAVASFVDRCVDLAR